MSDIPLIIFEPTDGLVNRNGDRISEAAVSKAAEQLKELSRHYKLLPHVPVPGSFEDVAFGGRPFIFASPPCVDRRFAVAKGRSGEVPSA